MKKIKEKKKSVDAWINKLIYGVALSLFVITVCFIIIIAALYFFVMFISVQLSEFIKELPVYQSTLAAITGVSLAYIFRKFR
jgi:predicted PurR-regulated permease PerM